jgi:hypothetical protein
MSSYFKISYRSNKNGYFEERTPKCEQEQNALYALYERCKKEGALPKTDPAAHVLIQTMLSSANCPPVFKQEGINGVYIEFNTVSSVMD